MASTPVAFVNVTPPRGPRVHMTRQERRKQLFRTFRGAIPKEFKSVIGKRYDSGILLDATLSSTPGRQRRVARLLGRAKVSVRLVHEFVNTHPHSPLNHLLRAGFAAVWKAAVSSLLAQDSSVPPVVPSAMASYLNSLLHDKAGYEEDTLRHTVRKLHKLRTVREVKASKYKSKAERIQARAAKVQAAAAARDLAVDKYCQQRGDEAIAARIAACIAAGKVPSVKLTKLAGARSAKSTIARAGASGGAGKEFTLDQAVIASMITGEPLPSDKSSVTPKRTVVEV